MTHIRVYTCIYLVHKTHVNLTLCVIYTRVGFYERERDRERFSYSCYIYNTIFLPSNKNMVSNLNMMRNPMRTIHLALIHFMYEFHLNLRRVRPWPPSLAMRQ